MADLVPYRPEALARQQREHIKYIVQVTQAAQREIGRIHTEAAKEAVTTLTYTTERIQAAARDGMNAAKVAELVEQQKLYLETVRQQAAQGAAAIAGVVQNRRLTG